MEKIPDANLFMWCRTPAADAFAPLPDGFAYRSFSPDLLEDWICLQTDGKPAPDETEYLTGYYSRVYSPHTDLFSQRWHLLYDGDTLAASCMLWEAFPGYETIHWLKVHPLYEGRGLGRAILTKTLENHSGAVFLHTQPASYRAIKLYTDFGFALLTDSAVGHRENHLTEVLPVLSRVMTPSAYQALRFAQCPAGFLTAAASVQESRF